MKDAGSEKELDELLSLIEERVDSEHASTVDRDYAQTPAYRPVETPPLVVLPKFPGTFDLPAPWGRFTRYGYRESFGNPAAMLQNALLNRVVPGVLFMDHSPLAIGSDHGTIQVASVLGGRWRMHKDQRTVVDNRSSLWETFHIRDLAICYSDIST